MDVHTGDDMCLYMFVWINPQWQSMRQAVKSPVCTAVSFLSQNHDTSVCPSRSPDEILLGSMHITCVIHDVVHITCVIHDVVIYDIHVPPVRSRRYEWCNLLHNTLKQIIDLIFSSGRDKIKRCLFTQCSLLQRIIKAYTPDEVRHSVYIYARVWSWGRFGTHSSMSLLSQYMVHVTRSV
jgi:hypothetical protein